MCGKKFTPKPGARKGLQSPDYILLLMPIHVVTCPYCGAEFGLESPLDHIFMARRICPECKREFLIKDGKAEKSPN